MLSYAISGTVQGVDGLLVRVEVDLAPGLPAIHVVGLAENAVREGKERVLAALHNAGFSLPPRKITINLSPADVPKSGSAFDLPIALALLAAAGALPAESLVDCCVVGELGLDGTIRPVRGALSIALRCRRSEIGSLIVPRANAAEACSIDDLGVYAADSLEQVVAHCRGSEPLEPAIPVQHESAPSFSAPDLADVRGQEHARRALEVAAAGAHNLLMIGAPGSGKSMLARRLPGILPPLAHLESIEATCVHSVAGRLRPGAGLLRERPFRAPHHTISDAGLVGGGSPPRPGEISLAHRGVLFLDELPEFKRSALETLRQPLEDAIVQIGRARIAIAYPASFMLVAAMNPCPCGHYGSGDGRCVCQVGHIRRYVARVSGPLMDRIDVQVEVPPVPESALLRNRTGEPSAAVRARVRAARDRQEHRLGSGRVNADLSPREVRMHCALDSAGEALLRDAMRRLALSARAFHRILKVARTIADLDAADAIAAGHIAEAIQYRTLDRAARGGGVAIEPV